MKTLLLKILLIIIAIAFFLGMFGIAELLASVISINTVMSTVYVALVLGFIYLIRN